LAKPRTPIILLFFALLFALPSAADAMRDRSDDGTATAGVVPRIGTVFFNGLASRVGNIFSYETSAGNISTLVQGQNPKLWDGLNFLNNDIQVVSDPRYGHVY
jgi:hypothetical protein